MQHSKKVKYFTYCAALLITAASCNRSCYYEYSPEEAVVDQTYVHKYGVPVCPRDWAQRGENGRVISTLKNGIVISNNYQGGILDGDSTYSFPHSENIEKVETYVKGDLQKERYNYFTGQPYREVIYTSPTSRSVTLWYQNGVTQSREQFNGDSLAQGEYYNTSNQIESRVTEGEGQRIVKDSYGQLLSTDTIHNGVLAAMTTYHSNGNPKEIITYKDGLPDGLKKTYLPDGQPLTIEGWKAGYQDGLTTVYQNGEKYADIYYKKGLKNGIEKRYKDGQTVVAEISWQDDVEHGPYTAHIGSLTTTDWYYQGKVVSKAYYELLSSTGS